MSKKIVVVGGGGLIGTRLVALLRAAGHEVTPASPRTGVNALTGEGLAEALQGASVVVDVTNAPSYEEKAVLDFFTTSTRNLLAYEAVAGVGHHIALSIVGIHRSSQVPYFRAKIAQEQLIRDSSIPYSIVQATQFFEFVKGIADYSTVDGKVVVPAALIQPIAADDVTATLARVAEAAPLNGTLEIAGPDRYTFEAAIGMDLNARHDAREIVVDPKAGYFGAGISETGIVPLDASAQLGATHFEDWLRQTVTAA
ncbi:SDR family oxidoreductase [Paludibaculum fermentans]|uniref:SDR family oxidoreductase n=1 Tax=Paludibaculum fermentans TaxID=1473598 RepID=A0A7S7NXV9_PALFE|nr:NmrA family NAD(P)-binding protein [Paludibaculum fermentans]QOY91804.1 SDR family oxidoreductase [Paludibaculum fermentans]